MRAALCLALIWCAPLAALAQDRVHLPAEVDLARLVDLSAERLGLRIAYEPRQLAGSFMVRSGDGVDDEGLWALTNELLVQKNLTTISTGDGLAIVQLNGAGRLATPIEQWAIEQTDSGPRLRTAGRAGYVAIVYDIKEADPETLMSAVQPLLSAGGSVTRLGDSDRVIVADLRDRVGRVVSLMQALDIRTTVTRSYEPRVFSPGEVGEAVKRLIG
ncbi:MAG: hypothetical protein RIE32_12550 [Phycisphaerales bacterium]